jgi:hypothetical protein
MDRRVVLQREKAADVRARELWKTVVADGTDFLDSLVALLDRHHVRYCLIGGQAVNAYVEPLVSLDLDLAVAVDQLPAVEDLLRQEFLVEPFAHSLNVTQPGSDLRVQIQTDPRYGPFVDRAAVREVLGMALPVGSLADVLQGKIWAATDPGRRPTKRRKDLLDIERLIDAYPDLRSQVPGVILAEFE